MGENLKVKITLPDKVSEVIRQQKINALYDLLNKPADKKAS